MAFETTSSDVTTVLSVLSVPSSLLFAPAPALDVWAEDCTSTDTDAR